jgi:hypothetical protein
MGVPDRVVLTYRGGGDCAIRCRISPSILGRRSLRLYFSSRNVLRKSGSPAISSWKRLT